MHLLRCALAVAVLLAAAPGQAAEGATAALVENHRGWGWNADVLRNGLVTLAVVPEIGGRAMQYDLGAHECLWANPRELGKRSHPGQEEPWRNFGGYKTWLAPQVFWRRGLGVWPPPPQLDGGRYACTIAAAADGRAVLDTVSPIEDSAGWQALGLQLSRRYTLYPDSTRVQVEQTVRNAGMIPVITAIWDDTQIPGDHQGAGDYGNFWVYFPLNRRSAFGRPGYMAYPGFAAGHDDPQWISPLGDGIGAVRYQRREGKLGADSDGGWICAVDSRDGVAFAKRFRYSDSRNEQRYPEGGISCAVYTSGGDPFLEMEVMAPMVDLAPGASAAFVEDWYAAHIAGPVLAVTEAGIVTRHVRAVRGPGSVHLDGAFGVFARATARVCAIDASQQRTVLAAFPVTPEQAWLLAADVPVPAAGAQRVVVELAGADGALIGILDELAGGWPALPAGGTQP